MLLHYTSDFNISSVFAVLLAITRSSHQRLALVDRLTKRLSLVTDTDDIVLNFVATNHGSQSETDSVQKEVESQLIHLQRGKMFKFKNGNSLIKNETSWSFFFFLILKSSTFVSCLRTQRGRIKRFYTTKELYSKTGNFFLVKQYHQQCCFICIIIEICSFFFPQETAKSILRHPPSKYSTFLSLSLTCVFLVHVGNLEGA